MASEKLEPRLQTFIDHQKVRATAGGMAAASVEDVPIPVTIAHHEAVRAEVPAERADTAAALRTLADQVSQQQRPVLDRLRQFRAQGVTVHSLTNAVSASLTPRQLREVSQLDEVELIRLDTVEKVTCMHESVHVIEALEAREDFRVNGRAIKVAILDTGIDANHPALLGKVVDQFSTVAEPVTVPGDHGTHVAGTVASNDAVFRGVAPQAELINIKVLTAAGFGSPTSVIAGLDQAVRRGALVASLSLGWSEIFHGWVCNDANCILCQAADNTARLGVTVVVAAGNEGNGGAKPPFAIRHPGAARSVITVGAVSKAKTLAPFSSIGPGSGRLSPASPLRITKPELSAPGVDIMSSVLGGGFASFSGTSMATPHVAGVTALILQKNPALTPRMVKKILEDACEPVADAPNEAGYGLANTYSALLTVTAAGTGIAVP